MTKTNLNLPQRIIAMIIYIVMITAACYFFNGQSFSFLLDSGNQYNLLFVSAALLLILGSYVAEPYFTKPTDVLANSIAIFLALLSINESDFIGYGVMFYTSISLLLLSIFIILAQKVNKRIKVQHLFFSILTKVGQSKVIFSAMYLLTIASYFGNAPLEFTFFLTFWVVFISQFVVEESILWFSKIFQHFKNFDKQAEVLGEAIGCDNPFLYKVEVDFFKHKARSINKGELVYLNLDGNMGAVGIIVNEKQLLNKKWITVYLLEEKNEPIKINLKLGELVNGSNTIFSKDRYVYTFDIDSLEDEDEKNVIRNNELYKKRKEFIGYIADGSDINQIKFYSLIDPSNEKYRNVREGAVVTTKIHNELTLFQIIDGKTEQEDLEKHDTNGYLVGIAQKLGKYEDKELKTVEWLPNIYTPVFFADTTSGDPDPMSIGVLPTTNFEIVLKEPNLLVTHNTAILGILGIGKSCLTFELLQKIVNKTDCKVICIDITNEYKKELITYISADLIQDDFSQEKLAKIKAGKRDGNKDDPTSWGNESLYKTELDKLIKDFDDNADKSILLLNPDWHSVSKAGGKFNIAHRTDLTVAEKTRLIAERSFVLAKSIWDNSEEASKKSNKAKFLLVFEEAHSLVPEWNSSANEGDQSASNGTVKVILQGRKYGLGSFVITQRTANISKSILNQCNTIFAMRVFDDTGKQFLENYIGSSYANTLPTLKERHAVVIGKALKLKQPVIVELNDRKRVLLEKGNSSKNESVDI